MRRSRVFENGTVSIEALIDGEGPTVVMIAALARPATDFDALAERVAEAGYTAVRLHQRGIGRSSGPMTAVTLPDLAGDVAVVIERVDRGPAVVIGHAFGQRVARMLATMRPDLVKGLIMLAAGGRIAPPREVRIAMAGSLDLGAPDDVRRDHVRQAFFAPGNDPSAWLPGWHPAVADLARGVASTNIAAWWAGGSAPIMLIQGLQDVVAPPENGRLLKQEFGGRVELVEIDGAGHALLPEQPEQLAAHVLGFLKRRHPVAPQAHSRG